MGLTSGELPTTWPRLTHGVMNSTLAPKPFSAFELAAGSAALAVVAAIAFVGLRVAQPQIPSPAAFSSFSTASIPSSWAVIRASGEQRRERSQKVDASQKPSPVDRSLADDNLVLPEPGGAKAPDSPTMDGRRRFDDMVDVEQRLTSAGLLWGFADGIGGAGSPSLAMSFDPKSTASRTELPTQVQTAEVAIVPSPPAQHNSLRRRVHAEGTFVGGWAYDSGECRQGQDHGAPLVMSIHAARTASSECDFRSVRREDASRWRIVAQCSREGESWNAHVDLKLAGSNLTWSSERGTAKYVRCLNH
jgi:hypothetical protein